jgi:hypothetical protein
MIEGEKSMAKSKLSVLEKIDGESYPDPEQENQYPLLQDGLPRQAFAIVEDPDLPGTWQLPHHTKQVKRAVLGKVGYEHTVDWPLLEQAVMSLSRFGLDGKRAIADPAQLIDAARHLAAHYRKANRPIPPTLCALI